MLASEGIALAIISDLLRTLSFYFPLLEIKEEEMEYSLIEPFSRFNFSLINISHISLNIILSVLSDCLTTDRPAALKMFGLEILARLLTQ